MDASCQVSLRGRLEALGRRMLELRTSLDALASREDQRGARDVAAAEELRRADDCLSAVKEVSITPVSLHEVRCKCLG
jgi:hypothetical protein